MHLSHYFYLYINNNSLVILNWNQWKAGVTFYLNLKISVELQSAYIGISLLADFKLLQGKPLLSCSRLFEDFW